MRRVPSWVKDDSYWLTSDGRYTLDAELALIRRLYPAWFEVQKASMPAHHLCLYETPTSSESASASDMDAEDEQMSGM